MSKQEFARFDEPRERSGAWLGMSLAGALSVVLFFAIVGFFAYASFRVEVPSKSVAVLTRLNGKDLASDQELALDESYKGVQLDVRREGRYFLNPYDWNWKILPQVEVPDGKSGVIIRLFGDDLPQQDLLATKEGQKGIVPGVLRPGRYPDYSNPFAYKVELHDPVIIRAGFKGVVTNMTGKEPAKRNQLLVEAGERGVQSEGLDPGTYYVNPYEKRIISVDCRTKKLDLTDDQDMGFPSKDGFWIRLEGTIQFHVMPEKVAEVYVVYNDVSNGDTVDDEIETKVILPYARSYCRLAGSSYSGRQFIEGVAREQFQEAFQTRLVEQCKPRGIAVVSALITKIYPPEAIAEPVRRREIAKQEQGKYKQQIEREKAQAKAAISKATVKQKTRLVEAEQTVAQTKTKAQEEQKVAVTKAEQEFSVSKRRLEASKDLASATMSKGKAAAEVIRLKNEAEASGLKASVAAFGGNGFLFAQNAMFEKLAPSFHQILANSSDSPIMDLFRKFQSPPPGPTTGPRSLAPSAQTPANNSVTPSASALKTERKGN